MPPREVVRRDGRPVRDIVTGGYPRGKRPVGESSHPWPPASGTECDRPGGSGNFGRMALMRRIRAFLSSPQGRRLTDQGRRMAADPRNRERARRLLARLRRR
ncbi:hypothetical protein GCM10009609_41120 [Pseudonocardia aurantiaca]